MAFVGVQHRPAAAEGKEPGARRGTTSMSHPSTPVRGGEQPRVAITRQGHRDGLHPRLGQEAMLRGFPSPGLHLGYSFVRCCGRGRSLHVIRWVPGQGPRKSLQGYLRMYSGDNLTWMDGMLGTFYQGYFVFRGLREKGEFWCHLTPKWQLVSLTEARNFGTLNVLIHITNFSLNLSYKTSLLLFFFLLSCYPSQVWSALSVPAQRLVLFTAPSYWF